MSLSPEMQALFAQLASRLKGLPAGSAVEIEVHDVRQQGLSEQQVAGAKVQALSGSESAEANENGCDDGCSAGELGSGEQTESFLGVRIEDDSRGSETKTEAVGGSNAGQMEGGKSAKFKWVYMDAEEALARHLGIEFDLQRGEGVPALAILDPRNGTYYVYPQGQLFNPERIEEFLVAFQGGKLRPEVKNERPPRVRKNSRAAFSLIPVSAAEFSAVVFGASQKDRVGQSGEKFHPTSTDSEGLETNRGLERGFSLGEERKVKREPLSQNGPEGSSPRSGGSSPGPIVPPGRHTVVLFTTGWCGFCQRADVVLQKVARLLEPRAETLGSGATGNGLPGGEAEPPVGSREGGSGEEAPGSARTFVKGLGGTNRVRVLRMDCSENDCERASGLQIPGYPSLLLFTADNGTEPVFYQGAFRVQDILAFLDREGSARGPKRKQ